jgi:long-chain-fatty-acid--CoA ligase ACSBG
VLHSIGSTATTVAEAAADPKVTAYLTEGIKRANVHAVSNAWKVQKFHVLPVDFRSSGVAVSLSHVHSVGGNELGPTLKLKRPVVVKKYTKEIDDLYAAADE